MLDRVGSLKLFAPLGRINASPSRLSTPARIGGCAILCASAVAACGWFGPSNSVRFTGWDGEANKDKYSRLPPLNVGGDVDFAKREIGEYSAESYEDGERRAKELEARWLKAADPEEATDRDALIRDRSSLEACLRELDDQDKRNTTLDLLDAFTALEEGSSPASIRSYMKARRAYDAWFSVGEPAQVYVYPKPPAHTAAEIDAEKAEKAATLSRVLEEVPADRNLVDNLAYLRAAITYREARYADAAREFESLVSRYPRSEKREASLLMAGLSQLKLSVSYHGDDASAVAGERAPDGRDAEWMAARSLLKRALREYPRGRYAADARGWLAFTSLRVGDTSSGLAEYYRMLADEQNPGARDAALLSLRLARPGTNDAEMRKVEAELADEPEAALAYAYHEIYNHAASLDTEDLPEEDESEGGSSSSTAVESDWARQERERRDERRVREMNGKELARVVEFATTMLRRYPRTKIGAEFALRLAEADFESGRAREAREFAARALGAGLAGEARAQALWTKGVAEYGLREYDAARRTLQTLLEESPRGHLSAGARRLVAMIAEDAGDLDAALTQYLALDYREDAAYFVDVLMTPEQLASFVEHHPGLPQRDGLLYALGVRYLRDGRYAEARAAYARIHPVRSDGLSRYSYGYGYECSHNNSSSDTNEQCGSPKLMFGDSDTGVDVRWVARDLQTINDVEAFDRAFASAQGDEAKAEALYQKASYFFESDLLFFNPAAWDGGRHYMLAELDRSNLYRAPGESDLLFRYSQKHDMAARALDLYLEVARLYPRTRAARDALYTAAVCHERLADYNEYWRDKYQTGLHAGARMVTYADVRATYPDYHLPRGTYGWEPSTRTVKGGPGWDAPPKPPKPKPPPTRTQRAERFIDHGWRVAGRVWRPVGQFLFSQWEGWVRRWLTVLLLLACAWGCHLMATRARRGLRVQLARLKPDFAPQEVTDLPAPIQPAPWLAEGGGGLSRAERAAALARRMARPVRGRLEPLLRDTHGRRALAANAAAHGILLMLLYNLLRTL